MLRIKVALRIAFFILVLFPSKAIAASVEAVYVSKVLDMDYKAIIVRSNGDAYLIEYGIGVLSLWRYEGRTVLIYSPGLFAGIGSKIIIPERDQEARIWDSKYLGNINSPVSVPQPLSPVKPVPIPPPAIQKISINSITMCEGVDEINLKAVNPKSTFPPSIPRIYAFVKLETPYTGAYSAYWYYLGSQGRELVSTHTGTATDSDVLWFWLDQHGVPFKVGHWELEVLIGSTKKTQSFAVQPSRLGNQILVNGRPLNLSVSPVLLNGRLLVPLRAISEALGASVTWNSENQEVLISSGQANVRLKIGSRKAYANGQQIILDVPAQILKGYTFVPLRFISESLGAQVNWDAQSNLVTIDT